MTGIMGIKRCGQCHFGEIFGADFSKRLCHGAPPSAVQVPLRGQMTLQMTRPVVAVTDRACALFLGKDVADQTRDEDAMKTIQGQSTRGMQ